MIGKWLNKRNNKTLIVFYNGWGMDEKIISHLTNDDYDIYMFYMYHIESDEKIDEFKEYTTLIQVSWSLGVFYANEDDRVYDKYIAINGTLNPVDKNQGIPAEIFKGTINTWNEANRQKFYKRICGNFDNYSLFGSYAPDRNIECQKTELIFIQNDIDKTKKRQNNKKWTKIISGIDDLIFTHDNQLNYWGSDIVSLKIPHFPFFNFQTWNEIIN